MTLRNERSNGLLQSPDQGRVVARHSVVPDHCDSKLPLSDVRRRTNRPGLSINEAVGQNVAWARVKQGTHTIHDVRVELPRLRVYEGRHKEFCGADGVGEWS